MSERLALAAHHEAGHAAAMHAFGKCIRDVTIGPGGSGRVGWCWGSRLPDNRADALARAIVAYSGPLAEYQFRKREGLPPNWHPSGLDNDRVKGFAQQFDWLDLPELAFEAAKQLIAVPQIWRGIETLADRLVVRRTLTGRTAHRIFRDHGVYPKRIVSGDDVFPLRVYEYWRISEMQNAV